MLFTCTYLYSVNNALHHFHFASRYHFKTTHQTVGYLCYNLSKASWRQSTRDFPFPRPKRRGQATSRHEPSGKNSISSSTVSKRNTASLCLFTTDVSLTHPCLFTTGKWHHVRDYRSLCYCSSQIDHVCATHSQRNNWPRSSIQHL